MLLHNTLHTRDIPTRTPHHFGDVGIAAAFTNQNRNISKVGHLAVLLQNRSDTAPPSCDAAEIQPAPKQYQLHGKPVPTTQTPRTNYTKTASGCVYKAPLDEDHPQRELRLGFDSSMRLLEVVVLLWDDGTEAIIHSMKARKQYRSLLD